MIGTSTSKEAKEYFSDMARHRIKFKYGGPGDDEAVDMAFSKKKIEERKVSRKGGGGGDGSELIELTGLVD